MKKTLIMTMLCMFFIHNSLAQETLMSLNRSEYPTQFLKRIENNIHRMNIQEILPDGSTRIFYNLDSKTDIEKLIFGDFNAPVEFIIKPDGDGVAPSGFRIVKNSSDTSCMLEVKYISNYDKVKNELIEKYPTTGFTFEQMESVTDSAILQSGMHNSVMRWKQNKESLNLYMVESRSFSVSEQLLEALYRKMIAEIKFFDSDHEGKNWGLIVTFRCVVDNEVWTLSTADKPSGSTFIFYDLCQQIIADAIANKLDEEKYLRLLNM